LYQRDGRFGDRDGCDGHRNRRAQQIGIVTVIFNNGIMAIKRPGSRQRTKNTARISGGNYTKWLMVSVRGQNGRTTGGLRTGAQRGRCNRRRRPPGGPRVHRQGGLSGRDAVTGGVSQPGNSWLRQVVRDVDHDAEPTRCDIRRMHGSVSSEPPGMRAADFGQTRNIAAADRAEVHTKNVPRTFIFVCSPRVQRN
jgi:hypothetical protein